MSASTTPQPAVQAMLPHTPMTQLLATATSLEADLRNLCVESRRKYPELQSSAERALVKLRALATAAGSQSPAPARPPVEVLQSDSVVRPFLLACGTKSAKLTPLALASLQKVVSLTPLQPRFLATVMGTLRIQAESEDQTVQLKILQTLLLTISPASVECGELLQGSLLQALSICCRLFLQRKNSIIHHTAFAALRQLITLLYDRVSAQAAQGTLWLQASPVPAAAAAAASAAVPATSDLPPPAPSASASAGLLPAPLDQLSGEAQNAYLLFQDLCTMAAGSSASDPAFASAVRPRWLTNLASPIPAEVCVELIEHILASNDALFAAPGVFFHGLLKLQLAPLLVKLLRSHFEFSMVLRLTRTIVVLTRQAHAPLRDEVEIFISLFIRMLNAEFPLWHRVLVLEAVLQLLHARGDKFAYWLFENYDVATPSALTDGSAQPSEPAPPAANPNQTKVFTSLIHALSKLVVQTAQNLSEGGGGAATSASGLAVGTTGLSSSALLTQTSASPAVTLTVPSSPAGGGAGTLQFGGAGSLLKTAVNAVNGAVGGAITVTPEPNTLPWRLYTHKGNRGLDLLNLDQEASGAAPVAGGPSALYEESYVITLGVECLVTLVNGFAALAKTNEKWGGSTQSASDAISDAAGAPAAADTVDTAVLCGLCDTACMPVLAALSYLLNKTQEESQIQHLLMSYQSFTNTCGVLELTRSRDAFLQNLAGFALPKNGLPRDDPPSEIIKSLFGTGHISSLLSTADGRADFLTHLSAILLSAKNLQSLKALFNIAHCLGRFLGNSSWLTVLETFQTLDTMIQISSELNYRLAREASCADMYQSLSPHQAEINIMAAALSRLFESTRYLDDQAVTHVLSALGTLSLSSLANAATSESTDHGRPTSVVPLTGAAAHTATMPNNISSLHLRLSPPQTMRMFALVNLIATLEHNMFRITTARLWEIGIGHLTCVINHKDALIRQYGVAALTKIAILALAKPTTYQQTASTTAAMHASGVVGSADPTKKLSHSASAMSKSLAALAAMTPVDFQSAIQSSLLEPFADLYRSKYEDTRENILMSVYQILQNSGQFLVKGGWQIVLAILQAVVNNNATESATTNGALDVSPSSVPSASPSPPAPNASSASLIHVGFNSIQLITNDYLESIPFSSLAALIQTIAAYCAQVSDTNISFTSIGLLWRVSDYMGTSAQNSAENGAAVPTQTDSSAAATPSTASAPVGLTSNLADSLMHLVFTSLVSLCTDSRTEVRNSAVKTLHNTLVAHATRMSLGTCLANLRGLVLPLLTRLLTDARLEAAPQQVANSTELGKDKATGKSVMMLIHYSRDTASKQWDETRVFALQGTARVIKVYTEKWLRDAATAPPDEQQLLMNAFAPQWLPYIELNLAALANRSPEVTLAALNSVLDLMLLLFAAGAGSASSTASANAGLPAAAHPPLANGSASTVRISSELVRFLWTPILERFYVRGVLHAVVQHKHLEWVEDRERQFDRDRKAAGSAAAAMVTSVDHAASPFITAFGDMSSEDGWKNWLKTYTHLLANLHTLLTHARRIFDGDAADHRDGTERDDLTVVISLAHVLSSLHAAYAERKAAEAWATRKINLGPDAPQPDRKETPIQAAHIKLIEAVSARDAATATAGAAFAPSSSPLSPSLWATIFRQLLSYLTSDYGSNDVADIELHLSSLLTPQSVSSRSPAPAATAATNLIDPLSFPSISWTKRVLRVFDRAYACAPSAVRAAHFASVLPVLQRVIDSAVTTDQLHRSAGADLAEESVATFIHVLEAGLGAINDQIANADATPERAATDRTQAATIWSTIVQIFASFLAPPNATADFIADFTRPVYLPLRTSFSVSQARVWENLQIALIGCLLRIVFPQIRYAEPSPREVAHSLIAFFNIGYDADDETQLARTERVGDADATTVAAGESDAASLTLASCGNELLSHSCLMALFTLVRLGGAVPDSAYSDHLLVSRLAAPLLMHRCGGICADYLALERAHPTSCPMPRGRREEMGFVLREIATLEMHPTVSDTLREGKSDGPDAHARAHTTHTGTNTNSPIGRRGHLLRLFPVLCQCITMRESELRELLRDVFQLAAVELGLTAQGLHTDAERATTDANGRDDRNEPHQ